MSAGGGEGAISTAYGDANDLLVVFADLLSSGL
jgi:hypothetical protein